jgi:DNA repair exonuclease SbcCD ATPase subunit
MNISSKRVNRQNRIVAADEDFMDLDAEMDADVDRIAEDDEAFDDTLDDIADSVEDMQDTLDEVQEDDVDIEVDNNVEGHLIAECDKCHGIFISAMMESEQEVEKISGICPLCDRESDQYFKWVIHAIE